MNISPALRTIVAAATLGLFPGCKFADALIGPRLPPSQSQLRKQAEREAAAAAAAQPQAPPGSGWGSPAVAQNSGWAALNSGAAAPAVPAAGAAPVVAGGTAATLMPAPATAVASTSAPASTPAPAPVEAPVFEPPPPRENPSVNSQIYHPEISKSIGITRAPQDDKSGPKSAIEGRLSQIEGFVQQALTAKGYTVQTGAAAAAMGVKVVIDYDSTPAMTAGDSGWDHEVKLSLIEGGDSLGAVSCRWSNLDSESIDPVLKQLTQRAAAKIPGPSKP